MRPPPPIGTTGASWPSSPCALVAVGRSPPCAAAVRRPGRSAGPSVVEVTTDTPLAGLPSAGHRHPGVPVYPGPYRVTQPDGTRITLTAWGDSRTKGYQTRAGYAVTNDATGVWRYAVRLDAAGPSRTVRARGGPGRAAGRRPSPADTRSPARTDHGDRERPRPWSRHRHGCPAGPGHPGVLRQPGQRRHDRGPVVGRRSSAPAATVAGYYQANSFGKFALTPAAETGGVPGNGVVGWLQLPYDHPDFGNDYGPSETKLGVDAVKAADPYVDYASFDTDGNGVLSPTELHVTVIVAGYETSYGGSLNVCGPSVWAHQGGLSGAAPKLDGTVVDRNGGTMFGEYMCTTDRRRPATCPRSGSWPTRSATTSASPTSTTPTTPAPGSGAGA